MPDTGETWSRPGSRLAPCFDSMYLHTVIIPLSCPEITSCLQTEIPTGAGDAAAGCSPQPPGPGTASPGESGRCQRAATNPSPAASPSGYLLRWRPPRSGRAAVPPPLSGPRGAAQRCRDIAHGDTERCARPARGEQSPAEPKSVRRTARRRSLQSQEQRSGLTEVETQTATHRRNARAAAEGPGQVLYAGAPLRRCQAKAVDAEQQCRGQPGASSQEQSRPERRHAASMEAGGLRRRLVHLDLKGAPPRASYLAEVQGGSEGWMGLLWPGGKRRESFPVLLRSASPARCAPSGAAAAPRPGRHRAAAGV